MKTITLSEIRTLVRSRGEWRSAYITNTELDTYINNACYKFFNMVSELDPTRYMRYNSISVVSGTQEYDLPENLYRMSSVYVTTAAGLISLDTFQWEERYSTDGDPADATASRWLVKGSESSGQAQDGYLTLMLQPIPTWTDTLYLGYIPTFVDLTNDTDDFDTIDGIGLEYIVSDAAIKCAAKEETDTTPWEKSKAEAESFIKAFIKPQTAKTQPAGSSNTLLNLQRSVRGRGGWSREVVSDITLIEWINSSYSSLIDIMIKYDDSYFLTKSDVSVVSGTQEYSLPANFYHLLGAAIEDSEMPDGYSVLERLNWDERYDWTYVTTFRQTKYMIRGGNITFHPKPNFSKTVRLEYIPEVTKVTSPTGTFNIPSNWQEWLILDTCIKIAALAGTDPSIFISQKAEFENRIKEASTQDIGKPKTVVDVRRRFDRRYFRSRRGW